MRFLKNHKVRIGKHSFYVRITNRAIIEYEELSGDKTMNFESTGNMLKFFYCTAKAGALSEKQKFNYSYSQFLDLIDNYFSETMTAFNEVMSEESEGQDEKKKLMMNP
jgi:hypothetical protein